MADKQVSVRISAQGGKVMKAELVEIGAAGKASFQSIEKSSNASRFALQNTAYQVQDVFVQVAAGTSASRALAQQLPQLLSGFGLMGVLAGTATALLIPLGSALLGVKDPAKEAASAVKILDEALTNLRSADKAVRAPKLDLEKTYGAYAAEAKKVLAIQRQIAEMTATKAFVGATQGFTGALGGTSFLGGKSADELKAYAEQLVRARTEQAALTAEEAKFGQISTQAQADAYEALQRRMIANEMDFQQTIEYRNAIADLATQFGVTEEQAANLAIAARKVTDADDTKSRLAAAQELVNLIFQQTDGLRGASAEAVRLFNSLAEVVVSGSEVAALDIANGIGLAADHADRLAKVDMAGQIGIATAEAWNLAAALGIALGKAQAIANEGRGPISRLGFGLPAANDPVIGGVNGLTFGSNPGSSSRDPNFNPYVPPSPKAGSKKGGGGGATNDAEREAKKLFEETRTEAEKYAAAQKQVNDLMKAGKIDSETYSRAMKKLAKDYDETSDAGKFFGSVTDDLKNAFLDLAIEGEASFDKIAKAIERALLQALAFGDGPLGELFGGPSQSLMGMIFPSIAGAKASGGPVLGSMPYLVGEKGPELFTPHGSGMIHKAGSFGGGQGRGTVVQIIDQRSGGQAVETSQKRGPDGREIIVMTVRDAIGRGEMDGAQKSRFGARPVGVKR